MYVVYGLEDPRDHLYHYVGITNDVYRRFNEHVTGSSGNIEKNGWIFECRQAKIMIVMREIERLDSAEDAAQREKFWIAHYRDLGHPLHNSAVTRRSLSEKPDAEQVLILSQGGRIVGARSLQLEVERDRSFFHLYPLTFGMLAAFFCTLGATLLFLSGWVVWRLDWLIIAGSVTAYGACILAILLYLYMQSLGIERKQAPAHDKDLNDN